MARPSVPDDTILDAAREAFLSEGPGASTSDIARRAGVSEALLFKRFESKHRLFLAAMGVRTPEWLDRLDALAGQGDPRANLHTIAADLLDWLSDAMPVFAMRWAGNVHKAKGDGSQEPLQLQSFRKLVAYFEGEMALGRLRQQDAQVVTRMLLGSLWQYVWFEMHGTNKWMPMPRTTYVRGIVDVLWPGLDPAGARSVSEPSRTSES